MTNETEQKILDAALTLFAEKGYTGATTRVIAERAGVSELTLFRKFKTKENLFDTLMSRNIEKMEKDFESIFINKKFKSHRDFLETFIKNYVDVVEKNFKTLFLFINDSNGKFEYGAVEFFNGITNYLEKNIADSNMDVEAFAVTLAGFTHLVCTEKYKGRNVINYENIVDKFINNSILCV